MYVGINTERGKRIPDREAFGYACTRCKYGTEEEKKLFNRLLNKSSCVDEFEKEIVAKFYTDNWLYDPRDGENVNWIIRFSDNSLQSFYGSYTAAVMAARELAGRRGLGFEVN